MVTLLNESMKRIIPFLIALFSLPVWTGAESYYLILSKRGTGVERIEMADLDECNELGEQWSEVSSGHTFVCLQTE